MDRGYGDHLFPCLAMFSPRLAYFLGPLVLLLFGCGRQSDPEFHVSDERFRLLRESPYTTIVVERDGKFVDMRFGLSRNAPRQSSIDLEDPAHLVLPYTRTMLAGVFVQPDPQRILLIGLGGGALNRFVATAFPSAEMTTVEIDPVVLDLARDKMGYHPGLHETVVVTDGRTFLKNDLSTYDWILVDAYGGGAVPPHLKTKEFYELLRARLNPHGVVILNIHGGNKLFLSDQATLKSVFPEVHLFSVREAGNVIALAFSGDRPDFSRSPAFDIKHTQLKSYLTEIRTTYLGPAEVGASVLTDDFVPVETLQRVSLE
jgi:spermidine synthase